ncbi:MAG: NAD(P)-dependent oxidoreductase [Eubacteriales bacterium]
MRIAMLQPHDSVPSIFSEKALKRLEKIGEVVRNPGTASDENVKKTIEGSDIAITSWGNTTLHADILDAAPNLRLIVHAAGSIKPIVCDAVWERGIRVTGSPKPLGIGVAETALGFTISAAKNYYNLNASLHNGGWGEGKENIRELYDLTVGVIGAGWAGGHYLRLMQNFDVETLLYDPYCSKEKAAALHTTLADLETVLRKSDIISIHAPSIPETNDMFNKGHARADEEGRDSHQTTARGSIINEADLYAHMKAGNLKYACIDVFNPEPPAVDNPLRTLPNVHHDPPHLAGLAANGKLRIGDARG